MSTLYRDYRPQNFSEILGQKHIKVAIQNEISTDKLAQSFLFCGPRAVGKTTLARVLAKAVNCLNRQPNEYEPCGTCQNCLNISKGSHLDILEIDAASNTGVDNVRENIISFSRLIPTNAKFKVFIIDEVHMLSPSAFNALLKIIEEPPTYVIFILCTTEIHKVPLTIISRCERFDFKRINIVEIISKLKRIAIQEKVEIDDEVLEAVAKQSGGHLRDAESLLGQVFALGDKKITLAQAELIIPHYNNNEAVDLITYLEKKDASKALTLINNLVDSGANIKNFISEVIVLIRKMIISKISPELSVNLGLNLGDALEKKINSLNQLLSIDNLTQFSRIFLDAYNEKNQIISQLPLELAVIELCSKIDKVNIMSNIASSSLPTNFSTKKIEPAINNKEVPDKKIDNTNIKSSLNTKQDVNAISLDHNLVIEQWPEFLVKIKKHNHSLSFVMQNCEPEYIQNNCLKITFKYKFHQDRISDPNIKNIIEETLTEVFGSHITVEAVLDENLDSRNKANNDQELVTKTEEVVATEGSSSSSDKQNSGSLMNNIIKVFGGEVIN